MSDNWAGKPEPIWPFLLLPAVLAVIGILLGIMAVT